MTFEPRRAEPNQIFRFADPVTGEQRTMKADDEGVLRPSNALEARVADSFDLPVARKVVTEEKQALPKGQEK